MPPVFQSFLLNRIFFNDLTVLSETHDFSQIEIVNGIQYNALIIAVHRGHLSMALGLLKKEVVKANAAAINNQAFLLAVQSGYLMLMDQLLKVPVVKNCLIEEASHHHCALKFALLAENNQILKRAAQTGYCEMVYQLAKALWPDGRVSMPKDMLQFIPQIKKGARLFDGKNEAIRILAKCAFTPTNHGVTALGLFSFDANVLSQISDYLAVKSEFNLAYHKKCFG